MAQIYATQHADEFHFPSTKKLFFGLVVGIIYIIFTFATGLTKLGNILHWSWVRDTGNTANALISGVFGATSVAKTVSFHTMWLGMGIGLLLFLASLILLSLRHLRFDLVASGFISLIVGVAFLHLVAWVVYIAIVVLFFVLFILGWVLHFVGFLFAKIGEFLGFIVGVVGNFLHFIFGSVWWVFALILAILVIYLAVKHRTVFFSIVKWGLVIGAIYLLVKLYQFLLPYLRPIFVFIQHIFSVVISFLQLLLFFLIGAFVVYGLGSLIIDQFTGAWHSGNGTRGAILGSLAIGTSIALILLQTNLYNVYIFFPYVFSNFASHFLLQSSLPLFDTIIALFVLGVSIIGVLRNLTQIYEEPSWDEFQSSLILAAVGVGAAVMITGISDDVNN